MSDITNNDKPGFVAERPEHCFACYRLVRPGQIRHLANALAEGAARFVDQKAQEG